MKSKQLANVLIKILGLSVCLYAIPACVSGIYVGLSAPARGDIVVRTLAYATGATVQAIVGLIIIALSRNIAGLMFRTDEE